MLFCGKDDKDEGKKTEGRRKVMSCPDLEPGTPRSPTICPVDESQKGCAKELHGFHAYHGYMRVYSVTSWCLVSCPLV